MTGSAEDSPVQPIRTPFRWEVVAAGVCFFIFWLDASTTWMIARALPPGEVYNRLAFAVPFFVLTPALAVSAVRNPHASRFSRWLAAGLLLVHLTNDSVWFVVRGIIRAASM